MDASIAVITKQFISCLGQPGTICQLGAPPCKKTLHTQFDLCTSGSDANQACSQSSNWRHVSQHPTSG